MYRNDEKRQLADKWNGWADFLQFSSLGGLFAMIFILESLSKAQARVAIWYLAAFLFVYATIAFFVARKALKYRMAYMNAEHTRVSGLFDQAIKEAKKSKS